MKKLTVLLVLFAVLLCAFSVPVNAEQVMGTQDLDEGSVLIDVEYSTPTAPGERHWDFEFNDRWFCGDAREYNHKLARMSLGLTFSAFRAANTEVGLSFLDFSTDKWDKGDFVVTPKKPGAQFFKVNRK